jgi:hypothetical protein
MPILERVDAMGRKLRGAAENGLRPFGVEDHGFRIAPPVAEEQVLAFERSHQVELPAGYRAFITRVGSGGAGPAYGMFPFERAIGPGGAGDFFALPFPHAAAFNPVDLFERPPARDEPVPRWRYDTQGTLVLCDEGCGYLHFLVITGAARGQMWLDGRVSDVGFVPLGVDFLDWYERWLDHMLAGGSGVWWLNG